MVWQQWCTEERGAGGEKKKENMEIKDEDENVPISCHAI